MATVAAVFTRAPWVRTPEQVVGSLFRIQHQTPAAGETPPRPENKRVWASLLKGKTAVIKEVAEEMQRRDPQGIKTRVALTDGDRALQILVEGTLGVTLILDLLHVLEKLWKAAYVFHAEGSLEAELWVLDRTLRILFSDVSQVVPWALSFVSGATVLGFLFARLYRFLPGTSGIVKGAAFAVLAWALMNLLLFPAIGLGFFGLAAGLGAAASLFSLAMLLVYSTVAGVAYAMMQDRN